jgi:FtsP/CotA-like multicopper oxidase with cupredoxin domain
MGFRAANPTMGEHVDTSDWYFENGPKDTIFALPDIVTKIKTTFDRPGRFVWNCHIMSYKDNAMMRAYEVSP